MLPCWPVTTTQAEMGAPRSEVLHGREEPPSLLLCLCLSGDWTDTQLGPSHGQAAWERGGAGSDQRESRGTG
jgi:hypothetical protein